MIIGNVASGKTTLGKKIQEITGFKFVQIDQLREKYLKGAVSEEYYCFFEFLKTIEENKDLILEFTGVGCHKYAVKRALQLSNDEILIVSCKNRDFNLIIERIGNKKFAYRHPFDIDIKEHIHFVKKELNLDIEKKFWNCEEFEFIEVYMDDNKDLIRNVKNIPNYINL